MLAPYHIRIEHAGMKCDSYIITEEKNPSISWGLTAGSSEQSACRILIKDKDELLWDTGWIPTQEQSIVYNGKPFVSRHINDLTILLKDIHQEESLPVTRRFCYGGLDNPDGCWIGEEEPLPDAVVYFTKAFACEGRIKAACLYSCGIGYQRVYLNGEELGAGHMNPAFSQYNKTCYYEVFPEWKCITECHPSKHYPDGKSKPAQYSYRLPAKG